MGEIIGSIAFSQSINKRQRRQQRRINQRIKSGSLTKKEAIKAEKGVIKSKRMERRFKSAGSLTRKERIKVQRQLNKSSANIYKSKHNKKTEIK